MNEDISPTSTCSKCGPNEVVFTGEETVDMFCKWLFSKQNKHTQLYAHSLRSYDSFLILDYLYKNAIIPSIIPNGSKNMSIEVPHYKMKFLDSINFIPTALKNLPKMFGLSELAKGYFPHLFNTKANQNVKLDHLPDESYYSPDSMKSDDRAKFKAWYDENKDQPFDMQTEIVKYCRSDVDILRRASLEFRKLFMEVTDGVDPFYKSITIAAACMKVFKTNFLQENTIALIPAQGYCPEQKQSLKALQWLKYLESKENISIQHAYNGGEKQVGNYKLDGFYETEDGNKVALEFHGDFWHGCTTCYSRDTVNTVNKKTMEELYQSTITKQQYLESEGFIYRCIWECEWERLVRESPELQQFVSKLEIEKPLDPREAFFGGRTETFQLYKEACKDETIKYYDVTSLYPFINKYGKYPLGHPVRIFKDFRQIEEYEGLIKCSVLPPKGLLIPVLPSRINNKLMFALCKTCAATGSRQCTHNDSERVLKGVWCTDEIKKALQLGYKIVTISEVWHFKEVEQYNSENQDGGLFTEYIDTFLKLKQEASGWPSWCQNEEDKQMYISTYYEREGIQLDYNRVQKNPGLRSLAKLMLNSFWGKFGQRSNMTQLQLTDKPKVYFDLLTSDKQEVTDVNFVSDDIVEMRWKYKDEFVETNSRTNVIIAAYTTCQARLKLYEYLEELGPRVLYADTDSVIFTTKEQKSLPLGDYLGDLTDEVPEGIITQFVSAGPKNYALTIDKSGLVETMTKVRGITLNFKTALQIDFDTVKQIVDNPKKIITTENSVIRRNKKKNLLLTTTESKDYKMVFDKRVITNSYQTLPYGY